MDDDVADLLEAEGKFALSSAVRVTKSSRPSNLVGLPGAAKGNSMTASSASRRQSGPAGSSHCRRMLTDSGVDLTASDAVRPFQQQVAALLRRAQEAGAVREDVRPDEVMALLAATCQGALQGGWDADLRARTLAIVFTGLRPR